MKKAANAKDPASRLLGDPSDPQARSALMVGCLNGHLDVAKYLLKKKHGVDHGGAFTIANGTVLLGCTPFGAAAYRGHVAVMKLLYSHGANPTAVTRDGMTPLFLAAMGGQVEAVQYLVDMCDVDPHTPTKYGTTPLFAAAAEGHLNVVEYLCTQCDADPEAITLDSAATPLIAAAAGKHLNVVSYLCEKQNVNINARARDGTTALYMASRKNAAAVVAYLASVGGADATIPNREGVTPLCVAAARSSPKVTASLLTLCAERGVPRTSLLHGSNPTTLHGGTATPNRMYVGCRRVVSDTVSTAVESPVDLELASGTRFWRRHVDHTGDGPSALPTTGGPVGSPLDEYSWKIVSALQHHRRAMLMTLTTLGPLVAEAGQGATAHSLTGYAINARSLTETLKGFHFLMNESIRESLIQSPDFVQSSMTEQQLDKLLTELHLEVHAEIARFLDKAMKEMRRVVRGELPAGGGAKRTKA